MPASRTPRPWEVQASDYVYRLPWLTVRKDRVRVPTGAVIDDYYVLEYPTWVNVVAVTPDVRFVLVRQYRHGSRTVNFELPSGVVEPPPRDVDSLAAAQRELLEETGYGGGEWSALMTLSANAGTHSNLTHSFLARGVLPVGPSLPESTEDLEVHLVTPAEVESLVLSGQMIQALNVAPLLKYLFTCSGE